MTDSATADVAHELGFSSALTVEPGAVTQDSAPLSSPARDRTVARARVGTPNHTDLRGVLAVNALSPVSMSLTVITIEPESVQVEAEGQRQ